MKTLLAPGTLETNYEKPTIFLGGSIEMGTAIDWQTTITNHLKDVKCTILNPRRVDWDASWKQSISNPKFKEQVDWELDGLELADIVVFYFDPATKSPITLFELGLLAGTGRNIIVCCEEPFWRKGNVDIYCQRFGILQVTCLDELLYEVKRKAESMGT